MGVYEAWKKGYSGKGVVIAVLDDGMDINHIDLKDNYVKYLFVKIDVHKSLTKCLKRRQHDIHVLR
jgi:subtilisin family serine protease